MKRKYIIGIMIGILSICFIITIKPDTKSNNKPSVTIQTEDTNSVVLEEPSNVSTEDTLNVNENVVTLNEYTVVKDGIKFNFLFSTPDNSDDIIDEIKDIYEKDFKECVISYTDDMNYQVTIDTHSFVIIR